MYLYGSYGKTKTGVSLFWTTRYISLATQRHATQRAAVMEIRLKSLSFPSHSMATATHTRSADLCQLTDDRARRVMTGLVRVVSDSTSPASRGNSTVVVLLLNYVTNWARSS